MQEREGDFSYFFGSFATAQRKNILERMKDVAGKGESWKQGTYNSSEDGETTEKSGEGNPQLSLSDDRKKSFS